MPKYVLTYFNFRARAELPRLLFAVAGEEFEDKRITKIEDWLEIKPKMPFGQLPILEVDGEKISQSLTIARFLAGEFGLAGNTPVERAKADMVVECISDMMDPIMPCYREKDPAKKDEMRSNYEDLLPDFLEKMENLLKLNQGGDGYFVGDSLSWADLAVMNAWHWIPGFGVFPQIHKYPKLQAHRLRIEEHPKVADWLERRPETPV